jgi:hypothetical protein
MITSRAATSADYLLTVQEATDRLRVSRWSGLQPHPR